MTTEEEEDAADNGDGEGDGCNGLGTFTPVLPEMRR